MPPSTALNNMDQIFGFLIIDNLCSLSPIYRESRLPVHKMQLNYFGVQFLYLANDDSAIFGNFFSFCPVSTKFRKGDIELPFTCSSILVESSLHRAEYCP